MNETQLGEVARAWSVISESWGFEVASVVRSLPNFDAWVVGMDSGAACLIGRADGRAYALRRTGNSEFETTVGPADQIRAEVRDSFSAVQRSHPMSEDRIGNQARLWTFTVLGRTVTIDSAREHIDGKPSTGAPDEDWQRPRIEEQCRRLAFAPEIEDEDAKR